MAGRLETTLPLPARRTHHPLHYQSRVHFWFGVVPHQIFQLREGISIQLGSSRLYGSCGTRCPTAIESDEEIGVPIILSSRLVIVFGQECRRFSSKRLRMDSNWCLLMILILHRRIIRWSEKSQRVSRLRSRESRRTGRRSTLQSFLSWTGEASGSGADHFVVRNPLMILDGWLFRRCVSSAFSNSIEIGRFAVDFTGYWLGSLRLGRWG